jgi:Family of unknown function (DUF6370)
MKAAFFATALLFLIAGGASSVRADEGAKAGKDSKAAAGEVTLKGDMVCGKCALHETEKCQNVLKVMDGGKETRYYLEQNKVAKENHEMVCSGKPKAATVKGKVSEAASKKTLVASSIKYE